MTLGIAIPTYSGHLHNLPKILDILNNSTLPPDKVSVSCSSQSENVDFGNNYNFELIVKFTGDYKNPSQNRNIAGQELDTDIISFIDGDDLPHVQRNEYIMKSFENNDVVAILHNYYQSTNINDNFIVGTLKSMIELNSLIIHYDYLLSEESLKNLHSCFNPYAAESLLYLNLCRIGMKHSIKYFEFLMFHRHRINDFNGKSVFDL